MANVPVAWLEDPASLLTLIASLVTALGALVASIWRQGKKVGKTQDTISDLCKEVAKIDGIEKRLTILETRFEPFLKVVEDSLGRMVIGGNPLDASLLRKITLGLASVKEIEKLDLDIVKELEEKGPEALSLVVVRYWLALKKAEALETRN